MKREKMEPNPIREQMAADKALWRATWQPGMSGMRGMEA